MPASKANYLILNKPSNSTLQNLPTPAALVQQSQTILKNDLIDKLNSSINATSILSTLTTLSNEIKSSQKETIQNILSSATRLIKLNKTITDVKTDKEKLANLKDEKTSN